MISKDRISANVRDRAHGTGSGGRFLAFALAVFGLLLTATAVGAQTSPQGNPANTFYAVNTANRLLSFSSTAPGTILTDVAVSGLQASEELVGIDFRPATGQLYGLGSTSRLYTINTSSGAATMVGTGVLSPTLSGGAYGFDFNPLVDRIRIVSSGRQDLRVHPDTGAVAAVDGTLTYTSTDTNASAVPFVVGAGYTNNVPGPASTVLYDIDANLNTLVRQNPPNNGTLSTVGTLGVDTTEMVGFDIIGADAAYASLTISGSTSSGLYTVDLTVGATTLMGTIGGGSPIRALTGALSTTPATVTPTATATPATLLYAVGATNRLVSFNSNAPGTLLTDVAVTGMQSSEELVGIDFRPVTGQLYGLGSTSRLYTINTASGAATMVGTGVLSPTLSGGAYGFDFNPLVDRIRIVSSSGQDLRVHPVTGVVAAVDGTLAYTSTDTFAGTTPSVVGAAYSNNFPGPGTTTLYDIDSATDSLVRQVPPNSGTLNTVGALGVDTTAVVGFDIAGASNAFASLTISGSNGSQLYTVNLTTGTATALGTIGGGQEIHGLTAALARTPPPCAVTFSDVQSSEYFYTPVVNLYCTGILSGYADGTFKPFNSATRGQTAKIVVLAAGITINTTGGPHFGDVPANSPFYDVVETAYNSGIISGYSDNTFRPNANVTRGQLAKIVVAGFDLTTNTTGGPHFGDVPTSNPFYAAIETAFNLGLISGYDDNTFRWGNDATRGQIAKIVDQARLLPSK